MIQLQLISRDEADLQWVIKNRFKEGRLHTFELIAVRGGLRIRHKKYPGLIRLKKPGDCW